MPGVDQQESGQQSLSELTHPQLLLGGISDGDSAYTWPRSMVLSGHYRTSFTAAKCCLPGTRQDQRLRDRKRGPQGINLFLIAWDAIAHC